ncbi:MAG: hypothetical protein ABSE46_09400 [Terracidiphilus sp.]|jgi:hypothetical protein
MSNGRRTILSLVALGRISPADAERLLIAWNQGREGFWVFAACVAAGMLALPDPQLAMQGALHGLVHFAESLFSGKVISVHPALAMVSRFLGGTI